MAKLSEFRKAYYDASGTLSAITRQLAFAGIAIIWIFKTDSASGLKVPKELLFPSILITLGLLLDFAQYTYKSIAWASFSRIKENQGVGSDDDVKAPAWINIPTDVFFYLKVGVIGIAYVYLIGYIYSIFS